MRKTVWVIILVGILGIGWPMNKAQADVIIKVRALNPLETKETAVINYPLPTEITQEDILRQKITYSLDHSEEEESPKTQFQISFDKKTGGYFIDDKVVLLPKEVVTLEVHVKDVWTINKSLIEELYREVDGLLKEWEQQAENSEESMKEEEKKRETKEFALMMKGEILDGLDQILQRQDKNQIINVGVQRHIAAYEDNMEELRQIQQDVVLLANLIQYDVEESEPEEPGETESPPQVPPAEIQELDESQNTAQDEVVKDTKDTENIETIEDTKEEVEEL